ncbi:hypothetical protein [Niabella hirudinis]|uniref:hypothetical protein n=1 Tax=Niabella hirudinis TaxID=1285929 RepID=UPI003EBE7D1F
MRAIIDPPGTRLQTSMLYPFSLPIFSFDYIPDGYQSDGGILLAREYNFPSMIADCFHLF